LNHSFFQELTSATSVADSPVLNRSEENHFHYLAHLKIAGPVSNVPLELNNGVNGENTLAHLRCVAVDLTTNETVQFNTYKSVTFRMNLLQPYKSRQ
jgi:hypothetical protein